MKKNIFYIVISLCVTMFFIHGGVADELSSTDYKIIDATVEPAHYSTSSSFGLVGVLVDGIVGTSTSTSFGLNSGPLFYPFISSPIVSATAGSGQVSLTWTQSDGFLGWSPSSYAIGRATTSHGSYLYTGVGNVTSSTVTGLTNNTTYYFVILVKDSFGNTLATSSEISATPVASSGGSGGAGGGGGGGGGGGPAPSSGSGVVFTGRAYPKSTVTLLKDAQVSATTVAGADAQFSINITGVSAGNYIFSVYGEDSQGNRSSLLTFPVSVTNGVNTTVGGIFLAPTISVDKSQVKQGDTVAIFGQSVSGGDVTIQVNSEQEYFVKTKTDKDGAYLYNFDTSLIEKGQHTTKSKTSLNGEISSFSKAVSFSVGNTNVSARKSFLRGDVNKDGKVNLVDFSIVAYWYKRTLTSQAISIGVDINGDGKITLIDFSIMAFNWTG